MKRIEGFTKKGMCCIIGVCGLSLLIASFYDFQLSNAIYDEGNIVCILLAAYGQLPVSLGMSVFGSLLIFVCKKRWCVRSLLAVIGGVLLNAMAIFMCVLEPSLYFNQSIMVNVIVALVLLIGVNVLVMRYVKDVEKPEIIRFIKFGVFVIIAQLIIINIIKIPWGRPRMRMIVETPEAFFQPWWVIGSSMKSSLIAVGVASEEFKSFPSGHTASATCILIFAVLPMLKAQTQRYANLAFYIGLVVAITVAFSRIVMGAHFLSDITVGFLVSFLLVSIAYRYFYHFKIGGAHE